jgi:hypothetical protein
VLRFTALVTVFIVVLAGAESLVEKGDMNSTWNAIWWAAATGRRARAKAVKGDSMPSRRRCGLVSDGAGEPKGREDRSKGRAGFLPGPPESQ